MSDALLVLRDALLENPNDPPIRFFDAYGAPVDSLSTCAVLSINSNHYYKTAETNYKSKKGAGSFYTLEAVVFLMLHRDASYTEYLQEARAEGIAVVSLVDKKELIDYLSTVAADSSYVDLSAPLVPAAVFESEVQSASVVEKTTKEEKKTSLEKRRTSSKTGSPIKKKSTSAAPVEHWTLPNGVRAVKLRTYEDIMTAKKDFSFALSLARSYIKEFEAEESKKLQSQQNASLVDQITSLHKSMQDKQQLQKQKQPSKKRGTPIIIVPNAPTALISIFNARDFFENGTFLLPAEAKAKATSREPRLKIQRDGQEFIILDNPMTLSEDEWEQVVAVFVTGATWQFKGWLWEDPMELFQRVCGFYLAYDDVKIEGPVSTWKVNRLLLSRNRRHLDSIISLDFWSKLPPTATNSNH